jgi:hypothetical protein
VEGIELRAAEKSELVSRRGQLGAWIF